MEGVKRKLPEHVKRSIARHEAAADEMNKESAAMIDSENDPITIAEIRNDLARKKFSYQRTIEDVLSEFGLPPEHKVARRQIEERKVKV